MMSGDRYYLLTLLPSLADLNSPVPLTIHSLYETIESSDGPTWSVEIPALAWDLQQREAFLAGETKTVEPVVLSAEQVRNESSLPEYLAMEQDREHFAVGSDALWQNYYRWADSMAVRYHSDFLHRWVGYEVSLRNALVESRAKQLDLDAGPYFVAEELRDSLSDFTSLVTEWSAAATPLAGLRVIEQGRWDWLAANEKWFTFGDDELAAYAAKLLVLTRWHRLTEQPVKADMNP